MCPEFKDWKKLANIFLSKTVNLEFQNLMIKILATTLNWGESRKWIGISWISGCRSGFIHLRYFDPHTSSNKYRFNPILAVLPAVRKNMRFTRQPRSSSSSAVKVKITAPGLVFLLSSFMDKAACLLLWSWLPRRHYMQDSFIVQRIQPQLLHMAWIASVKQRLLYLVCTCCTTSLSLSRCFAAEFLFLLWAVYLCYAVRTVPSAFHEPRYMAIAVHNELILSAIFYVIR